MKKILHQRKQYCEIGIEGNLEIFCSHLTKGKAEGWKEWVSDLSTVTRIIGKKLRVGAGSLFYVTLTEPPYPDTWSDILLYVSVMVFLDEMNIEIRGLWVKWITFCRVSVPPSISWRLSRTKRLTSAKEKGVLQKTAFGLELQHWLISDLQPTSPPYQFSSFHDPMSPFLEINLSLIHLIGSASLNW